MVLPYCLRIIHATIQVREIILRDANNSLDGEDDVGDEPEDGVRGLEMRAGVRDLVIFDYDKAGDECQDRGAVEHGVDVGAGVFLLWGVGRLQDEDSLSGEEDAGGIQELMELLVEPSG